MMRRFPARLVPAMFVVLMVAAGCRVFGGGSPEPVTLRGEIEQLHRDMVAAFNSDPRSVASFYTDDATIMGGGSRVSGRVAIERYWGGIARGSTWQLEVLETGGDAQSPWVRGRSTLTESGRAMITEYVGVLKRGADNRLRFYLDTYVAAR